jgi:hypothetical protein
MCLARGPDDDLDVLSEGGEKVHEAFYGKSAGTVAHQGRDVGLFDPQNLAGFRLGDPALLYETVNLQREFCFQKFLFGMGQTEVGKNISAALLHPGIWTCALLHSSGHSILPFPVKSLGLA